MTKKGLTEFFKSIARAIQFFVMGLVVTVLVAISSNTDVLKTTFDIFGLTLPVGAWIVSGATLAWKAIDRWIYLNKSKSNGIALPFLQK